MTTTELELPQATSSGTPQPACRPNPEVSPYAPGARSAGTSLAALSALALAACGGGGGSAPPAVTGPPVPATPAGLGATAGAGKVTLAWSASTGATSYNVSRATNSSGTYATIGTSTSTSYVDANVTAGTTYYYVVSASDQGGTSVNCAPVAATPTAVAVVPPAPTSLVASAGNAQVVLAWNASAGATSYTVGRATTTAGPFATVGTTNTTAFTDGGLQNGTVYYYVVAGSDAAGTGPDSNVASAMPAGAVGTALTRVQAARFLAQAAFGGSAADIQALQSIASGPAGWLVQQFAIPVNPSGQLSHVNWLVSQGLNVDGPDRNGVQSSLWRKLISSPDLLRQRVVLALTDLFVVNTLAITLPFRGMAVAYYLDQLEANAFGTFRDLLLAVSRTPAMGQYLTFLNSVKANPVTGTTPDENYAREIMQLFSIGVDQLNLDGTPVPNPANPGVALATYGQTDVLNMAKVFTGWRLNSAPPATYAGANVTTDMVNSASTADATAKTVLGKPIAAGLTGEQALEAAVDILMAHPNMAPFISRQLIQRLVASNPSPAYVARVATVFQSSQADMKSVLTAILTDPEATSDANLASPLTGKLREPVVRFIQWARTFPLGFAPGSATQWNAIGNLSSPSSALAESPLQSPNVFFFFQPGYEPPQTQLQAQNLTAPEFGITNETAVAGYMNFMQRVVSAGIGGVPADYSAVLPLVNQGGTSAALLAELNVLLAAGQVSAATLAQLQAALDTIDVSTAAGQNNRLYAALTLMVSAPEYLVQK